MLHSLLHAAALTQILYNYASASSCPTRCVSSSKDMRALTSVSFVSYSSCIALSLTTTRPTAKSTSANSNNHDHGSRDYAGWKRSPVVMNRHGQKELLVPSVTTLYEPNSSTNKRQEKVYSVNRHDSFHHASTTSTTSNNNTSHIDILPSPTVLPPVENTEKGDHGPDTYMKLRREDDVKFRLTRAINEIWKVNRDIPQGANLLNSHSSPGHDRTESRIHWDDVNLPKKMTIRNLWKRRHARSIEEGIRREKTDQATETTEQQLSHVLDETTNVHLIDDGGKDGKGGRRKGKRYAARTIAGLISALAEEATGLEVEVDARNDTPFWGKHIDTVKINFSRLGVKALRMGGLDEALMDIGENLSPYDKETIAESLEEEAKKVYMKDDVATKYQISNSVDEIFDRIDVDNSGALDEEELARALSIASGLSSDQLDIGEQPSAAISRLASRLISIYDTNGDGVVDREEYKKLVEDMTSVRDNQRIKQKEREEKLQERLDRKWGIHPLKWVRTAMHTFRKWSTKDNQQALFDESKSIAPYGGTNPSTKTDEAISPQIEFDQASDISDDPSVISTISKSEGSIILSDLKLDLRRLLFGAVPIVKHVSIDVFTTQMC